MNKIVTEITSIVSIFKCVVQQWESCEWNNLMFKKGSHPSNLKLKAQKTKCDNI